MERTVKYSRQGEEWLCADREEALSIFLYELPDLTACNVFPPLHILNILLCRGWAGGNIGRPRFTWEPFEISEQEYQELLPRLLDPDWETMCEKLWRIRLPMQRDPEFDDIAERYTWMETVCKKHGSKSLEEEAEKIERFKREHSDILKKWQQYLSSLGDQLPELTDFVSAASLEPKLRQLFPFTSLNRFCFSRCTGYPFTHDIPRVVSLGQGQYKVIGSNGELLGRANAAQAVTLIVAALPLNCGPAVSGTAEQLSVG